VATFYLGTKRNVDTSPVAVVTSTSDSTIVLSILVSNTDGALACDATCSINNGSTVVSYVAHTIAVPADANVDLIANKLILPSGRSLRMSASNSGDLDAAISYVVV